MTSELRRASRLVFVLLTALAGCTSREPGIEVEVSMLHHMGSDPLFDDVHNASGVERGMVTDRGYGVTLSRIEMVIGRVELVSCDGASASVRVPRSPWTEALAFLSPVAVAHAHSGASPLALNTPQVLDLMSEDRTAFAFGTLAPPPGRYCALRVWIEPADADATGVNGDAEWVGRSLRLQGSFLDAATPDARPFALASDLGEQAEVRFVDAHGEAAELTLSESSRHAELRIELSYGHLLDGIDLRSDAPEQQQYVAIRNALDGLRAVIVE